MSAVHRSFPIALFFKKGVGRFGEQNIIYISSRIFENQPDEICSHLSEKVSKGKTEEAPSHSNEGKGKEKKKERGERKEE